MNKFILKSKTIIGLLVSAIPTLAVLFGINISEDDTVMIAQTADSVIQLMGLVYAAYGRFVTTGDKLYVKKSK